MVCADTALRSLFLAAGIACCLLPSRLYAQETPTADVVRAWQARAARHAVVDVTWTTTTTLLPIGKDKKTSQLRCHNRFMLSDNGIRWTIKGPTWFGGTNAYVDTTTDCFLQDNQGYRVFTKSTTPAFPSGSTFRQETFQREPNWSLTPILLAYRPLDIRLDALNPASWTEIAGTFLIGAHRCILLTDGNAKLWLDRDREYLPLRVEVPAIARHGYLVDITYEDRPDGTRVKSWTSTALSRGENTPKEITQAAIEAQRFANLPDPQWAGLHLTPGTVVRTVDTDEFQIIRADGSRRPVDRVELRTGVTWQQMMTTDPPSVLAASSRRNWKLFIWCGVIALIAYYAVRRRRV